MNSLRHNKIISLALALILLFSGAVACDKKKKRFELPADELLAKGKLFMKNSNSLKAREAFEQILEEYPNSIERIPALMLLADVHYNDEEFQESKFHYVKFTQQHPAHKHVDRAFYYSAMSDYRQMDIAARDQTYTEKAIEEFEKLLKSFPESRFAQDAKRKIQECKDTLALNIFQIGKFYFRTQSYQAAIGRFRRVMVEYPDQSYIDEAMYLMGESYYKEQNFEESQKIFKELMTKYPRSKFALELKKRIKTSR